MNKKNDSYYLRYMGMLFQTGFSLVFPPIFLLTLSNYIKNTFQLDNAINLISLALGIAVGVFSAVNFILHSIRK